jgi:hypothetical protein
MAEPAKTKGVSCFVWNIWRLTRCAGAAAMQCPLMKTAFECPLRQINTGDFHLIE